ncbi:hypothetical protein CCP2SC5_30013 [Azospirillaceae bacterium]
MSGKIYRKVVAQPAATAKEALIAAMNWENATRISADFTTLSLHTTELIAIMALTMSNITTTSNKEEI